MEEEFVLQSHIRYEEATEVDLKWIEICSDGASVWRDQIGFMAF